MKPMLRPLKYRAIEDELMDDSSMGGGELREALRQLRWLNRLFGAAAPCLYGVRRLWTAAGRPKRLAVLDVGCGSGDVNRQLLRWADKNGIDMRITLADITEEACAEARQLFNNEPRVQVIRCNLFELPAAGADIVTGSQFIHHFADAALPRVAQSMLKAARLGVVINDIHRHPLAWLAVWLATRVMSGNRYILNDGPLSVAKGFRNYDWKRLRGALDGPELYYSWRPLFRYAVIITDSGAKNSNRSG